MKNYRVEFITDKSKHDKSYLISSQNDELAKQWADKQKAILQKAFLNDDLPVDVSDPKTWKVNITNAK